SSGLRSQVLPARARAPVLACRISWQRVHLHSLQCISLIVFSPCDSMMTRNMTLFWSGAQVKPGPMTPEKP
uniref:Uncharacterized protein n=1 Tax=Echeneis naucrates TaxID=173247 RepID=A0A665WX80_ECHNA